ncbi:MAG: DUF4910 domain-containing protein [Kiritimatiellae bacterium]|nr:DUF4910 domain-containing protein [Kiritimatiellia bacterium]
MLARILDTIAPAIDGDRTLADIAAIRELDRWGSFDQHHKASLLCQSRFREAGLETEIVPVPADGATRYGDWIMPQAWNARHATLRLLRGRGHAEAVLCDYLEEPCSLIHYSKPTPRGGVTAELVVLNGGTRNEDYAHVDVRGKIILTRAGPGVKEQAVKHGAAGIVTDHMPEHPGCRPPNALPDARAWHRFGPDYPCGGWGMKEGHTQCWGFVLSPRQGRRLRRLAKNHGPLRLHAEVSARFYDGTLDLVMGRLTGRTGEEVLLNGHLSEIGAIDNASGCALGIEALRALNALIARGKLKRPRRGIRALFTYECMGTMAAAVTQKKLFRKFVAGLTLDCVGGREALCRTALGLYRNPEAQSSYADTLLRLVLERQSRRETLLVNWREHSYAASDNIIADPSIGVPCPLLMECPYTAYHSSADTPRVVDPDKLVWIGRAAAAYAYFIADAREPEARWLAEQVLAEAAAAARAAAASASEDRGAGTVSAERRLAHLELCYSHAVESTARLVDTRKRQAFLKSLRPLKADLTKSIDLARRQAGRVRGTRRAGQTRRDRQAGAAERARIPRRLVVGEVQLTRVPRRDRGEWHAMRKRGNITDLAAGRALFWADGQRSIAEIEERVAGETGREAVRLSEYFRCLAKYGYVRLLGAGRSS